MRILFDARSVRSASGVQVLRGLLSAWQEDQRVQSLYAGISPGMDSIVIPRGVEVRTIPNCSWLSYMSYRLPLLADTCNADVIFSPNGVGPRDPRCVVYFQDLSHFRAGVSQYNNPPARVRRATRAGWRLVAAQHWRLAVAVSREMAAEVALRVATPVVSIPNGVDVDARKWVGDRDFIFVMGGTGARKDEATAIRAWAQVDPEFRRKTVLKIAGVEPSSRLESLGRLARGLHVSSSVAVSGGIPRGAYLDLIAQSRAAISCSSLEAFGMPVAEALAIGAPVLCSSIPSHLDLLDSAGAGDSFPVGGAAELARKLEEVLGGNAPIRLLEEPEAWSWGSRGKQHIDAYERFM